MEDLTKKENTAVWMYEHIALPKIEELKALPISNTDKLSMARKIVLMELEVLRDRSPKHGRKYVAQGYIDNFMDRLYNCRNLEAIIKTLVNSINYSKEYDSNRSKK